MRQYAKTKRIAALLALLGLVLTGCGTPKTPVDIDLTGMSETMVYSAVFQMAENPEEYAGKTVRISGEFTSIHSEAMDRDYYSCSVRDEKGCCTEGIEFLLPPEAPCPAVGDRITVSGVYETYEEDGGLYGQLVDAVLEKG